MQLDHNEQALLSSIIKKGDLIKEVAVQDFHFEYIPNQKIFQAMRQLENKNLPIDIISLNAELGQELLFIGGNEYLSDIYQLYTQEDNFKTYERFILENFKIRKTKELMNGLTEINGPRDIEKLNAMIAEVNELMEQGEVKEFDLSEALYEIHDDVETEKQDVNGIPTGFTDLDHVLDGLNEEDLIILAARPSVGKTAFALDITTNICKAALETKGYFVDFFSLEMSDKQLLKRMLCSVGNIDSMKMKNARKRFSQDDWNKYQMAQGIVSKFKPFLDICDSSKVTVQEIRSRVKQNQRRHSDKRHVVVIDYLTLIQGSGRKERHLEVGEISRNLKRLARDLKVPVLLLAQLNRGVEQRADKRPMLSDLRDSGEIEQDADKILFLHRDDYYDKETENKNIIEVIAAKNRNGSLGTVSLAFIKEYSKFVNLEHRYDD